jgi:hypothetical protein
MVFGVVMLGMCLVLLTMIGLSLASGVFPHSLPQRFLR